LSNNLLEIQNLFHAKKYDLALKKIDKLLKLNFDPNLLINKTTILLSLERFSEAEIILEKLLISNPKSCDLNCNLGIVCAKQNKYDEAENYFLKSINLEPNYIQARLNLINLYLEIDEADLALNQINQITSENFKNDYYHQLLAEIYIRKLDFNKALDNHKICIAKNPNSQNYYLLGVDYLWSGDTDNAKKNFLKAMNLNSKNFEAIFALSKVQKIEVKSNLFQHILSQSQNKDNDARQLSYIFFTLHKIMEDEKNYKKAFEFLLDANRYRKKLIDFNLKELKSMVFRIKSNYPKINSVCISDCQKTPIFIVGMPRTGTSLLEQIISNNNEIFGAGELSFLHESFKKIFINKIDNEKLKQIGIKYLDKLDSFTDKNYVIDKLPLNFFWIGYIKKIIPNSKFIHITRDKRETCFSIFKNLFAEGALEFSYNEKDIIDFYNIYLDIINFWKLEMEPGSFLNLNYEDLVENPKEKTKEIFKYLNIEFRKEYINIKSNNRWVRTASDIQIRGEIIKSQQANWQPYNDFLKYLKNDSF
jgi:tetratricopeptide (TPR) repeat protein